MGRRIELKIDIYDDDGDHLHRSRYVESWDWENFTKFDLVGAVAAAKEARCKTTTIFQVCRAGPEILHGKEGEDG